MKLIMENWRGYVGEEQDKISIPPAELGLTLQEEILRESDKEADPEAYSLEELQALATDNPEKIRDAYKEMTTAEPSLKEPRGAEWKRLTKEKGSVVADLHRTIQDEGLVDYFTDKIKDIMNQIFKTDYITSSTKVKKIKDVKGQINQLVFKDFNPLQREIIRAIFHFTKLKVPVVRAPEHFKPGASQMVKYLNDGIEMAFAPSRETYAKAKVILEALYKTPLENVPTLWRGLGVALKSNKYTGLEDYKTGKVIDVGNIMSFSIRAPVAKQFAANTSNVPQVFPVVLQIPKGNLKRGVNVDEFSGFEGEEQEVVVGGDFVIEDIRAMTWLGKNRHNGYKDFETLWKDLGWELPWKTVMSGDKYDPAELAKMYTTSKTDPNDMIYIVKIKQID